MLLNNKLQVHINSDSDSPMTDDADYVHVDNNDTYDFMPFVIILNYSTI